MSTCISTYGEYDSHEPDAYFTCVRCFAFDEAAALETIARLRRGGKVLGETIHHLGQIALDATGSHGLISEDGDGDWAAVWERVAELPDRIADAWDQGYKAGYSYRGPYGEGAGNPMPPNPYQAATDCATSTEPSKEIEEAAK